MSIEKICQYCSSKYFVYPRQNKTRKYCSKKCYAIVNAIAKAKIAKEGRVQKTCLFCNAIYYVTPYQNKRSKYCSKKCLNTANSIKFNRIRTEKVSSLEYLMSFIEKDEKTNCWIWKGSVDGSGYGQKSFRGKLKRTHRIFYELLVGRIPKDKLICHRCDCRLCQNPEHMFIGTNQSNQEDMIRKNRQRGPVGEKNSSSKLTVENVLEIRRLHSEQSIKSLAQQFKVSKTTIERVINRTTWKHLP